MKMDDLIYKIVGTIIAVGQSDARKFRLGETIRYTPSEILEILKQHENEIFSEEKITSDLISREEALKVCDKYNGQGYVWSCIRGDIEQLQSAQPDIVHCKDCKKNPHWEWVGCPMTGKNTRKPNDFCSYAERREE